MASLLFFLYVGYALIHDRVNSNSINPDSVAEIRDDNYGTCTVFDDLVPAPWYTDICIPIYYMNKFGNVTVELFGENIGCSSGDDAKLFIFPVSSWEECTGLFGRRKTCRFSEASAGFGQEKCAYQCNYSDTTIALRIIRIPDTDTLTTWQLCEASNIFYEDPLCRYGPIGGDGGDPQDNRDCWIAAGRRFPTGLKFYVDNGLRGIRVYYGKKYCNFGDVRWDFSITTVTFMSNELITELIFYRDTEKEFNNDPYFTGIKVTTNYGNAYSAVDQGEEHRFPGEGLLYFHGRAGWYFDAVGVQFGKC